MIRQRRYARYDQESRARDRERLLRVMLEALSRGQLPTYGMMREATGWATSRVREAVLGLEREGRVVLVQGYRYRYAWPAAVLEAASARARAELREGAS